MTVFLKLFVCFLTLISFLCCSALPALSQSTDDAMKYIKIKRFKKLDDNFYRGSKPKPDDYPFLKSIGIKTIIDFRLNSEKKAFKSRSINQ